MKPEGNAYEKQVIIPKIWEEILDKDGQIGTVLITEEVSSYIRNLEMSIELFKNNKVLIKKSF